MPPAGSAVWEAQGALRATCAPHTAVDELGCAFDDFVKSFLFIGVIADSATPIFQWVGAPPAFVMQVVFIQLVTGHHLSHAA